MPVLYTKLQIIITGLNAPWHLTEWLMLYNHFPRQKSHTIIMWWPSPHLFIIKNHTNWVSLKCKLHLQFSLDAQQYSEMNSLLVVNSVKSWQKRSAEKVNWIWLVHRKTIEHNMPPFRSKGRELSYVDAPQTCMFSVTRELEEMVAKRGHRIRRHLMDVHWVLLATSSVRTSNQLRAVPEGIKSVAIMSVIISQNKIGNFSWTKLTGWWASWVQ